MEYSVSAQPRTAELARFWTLLNDGTISKQEPDGREIVASMKRAVLNGDRVEWHETCFCSPPLRHERATVYDQFFTDMQIKPLLEGSPSKGQRFWDYLGSSAKPQVTGSSGSLGRSLKYVPLRIL